MRDAAAEPSRADDVSFVRAVHGALTTRLCIDTSRVYATGHSRGGRFASRLASEMSDVFAAIAPVGGLRYPRPNNATRPVAVVAFHGTGDPVNPYDGGGAPYWQTGVEEAASAWARHNGCRRSATVTVSATVTKLVHDECDGQANVVLYRLDGMGHTWPGSQWYARRPGSARGSSSLEVSASELMCAFWEARCSLEVLTPPADDEARQSPWSAPVAPNASPPAARSPRAPAPLVTALSASLSAAAAPAAALLVALVALRVMSALVVSRRQRAQQRRLPYL